MNKSIRICGLAFALLLGAAQGLSFPEKIVWLHAPVAGISPDGVTGYTNAVIIIGSPNNLDVRVFDTFNAENNKVNSISVANTPFIKRNYDMESKERFPNISETKLFFADPARTGKPFFSDLAKNIELARKYDYWHFAYTSNKKYIIASAQSAFEVWDAKTLKPLTSIALCADDDNFQYCASPSQALVNNNMNRLVWRYNSTLSIYKINFAHLPKSFAELEKLKIPIPFDPGGLSQAGSMSASPDGTMFFSGSVRDFYTGKVIAPVNGQKDIETSIFSYNNKYLATRGLVDDPNNPGQTLPGDLIVLRSAKTGKPYKWYYNVSGGPFFTKNNKLLYSDLKSNLHIITLPK